MNQIKQKRILLVDDNAEIHEDFLKILSKSDRSELDDAEAMLFGLEKSQPAVKNNYLIDSVYQGKDALAAVQKSLLDGLPFALAFIDMRMPPGWDGIETVKRIWEVDPYIQVVICTAYSDHSWEEITQGLGNSDNLLILKKTFEVIEISQLAVALTKKWELISNLHGLVKSRTAELEKLTSLNQATLESTQEGIIAVGLDGNILLCNQKFTEQWKLEKNWIMTENTDVIFPLLAGQVNDNVHFLEVMNDLLHSQNKSENTKEWQLNSGNTLELYSHPQYLHDEMAGMVYSFRDVTERKHLEKELFEQATHDNLTGLPNRALLMDRMNQTLEHAKRFNLHVGVLLIDLDYFKEVNDTHGHRAGDQLLICQAKKILDFVRANDTVARLGGDEFVVLLASQSDEKNFIELLNKFSELFLQPCQIDGREVMATASIGVSIYPRDGHDKDTLLKNADAALYHAKKLGRNRFQFYQEEFNKDLLHRKELLIGLSNALKNKEFILNYQPLITLNSGAIIGVEALLRWNHPSLGLILPAVFIPLAEESGHMIAIGEWVLRTACTQACKWQKLFSRSKMKISVNISVKQFRQKDFIAMVRKILEETGLNPNYLELEITESLLLGNITDVVDKMNELKSIGVRLAIDDFGTGYSSLSYLKHFPFDTVKIDKSFMDNIGSDPNNASIVQAIIGMTKNMGMDVLAEGVEDLQQVDFLRDHHSSQVQGYYFSEPLDVDACTSLLTPKGEGA